MQRTSTGSSCYCRFLHRYMHMCSSCHCRFLHRYVRRHVCRDVCRDVCRHVCRFHRPFMSQWVPTHPTHEWAHMPSREYIRGYPDAYAYVVGCVRAEAVAGNPAAPANGTWLVVYGACRCVCMHTGMKPAQARVHAYAHRHECAHEHGHEHGHTCKQARALRRHAHMQACGHKRSHARTHAHGGGVEARNGSRSNLDETNRDVKNGTNPDSTTLHAYMHAYT